MGVHVDIPDHATTGRGPGIPAGGTPAYLALHPGLLRAASFPPFALYAPGAKKGLVGLLREAGEPLSASAWEGLRQDFDRVYVREDERTPCYDYVEAHLADIAADASIPAPETARWLYRLACRVMETQFADPGSESDLERLPQVVGALVRAVLRDAGLGWSMFGCAPRRYSTPAHCVNVCILVTILARYGLGVEERRTLEDIALGGILHDVGKSRIPEEILLKRSPLTSVEFGLIRRHPRNGLKIARTLLREAPAARLIVWQHHEDANGGGYPEGTVGEAIDPFARAARIVDAFDALTTRRPYAHPLSTSDALALMLAQKGREFDADILQKFVAFFDEALDDEMPTAALQDANRETAQEDTAILEPAIRVANPPEPEPPAPQPSSHPPTATEAGASRTATAPRQPGRETDPSIAMMIGIAEAIRQAVEGDLPGMANPPAPADVAGEDETARHEPERRDEVDFARGLFPLIWQVDAARQRLMRERAGSFQVAKLRGDALAYLDGVRQGLVRVLAEHHIRVIEPDDVQGDGGARADHAHGKPRAGFAYTGGRVVELIQPASPALQSRKQHAG